jgi:hypothetical protein
MFAYKFHLNVCNLYAFSWVIVRRLNFICRCFGTLCLFHLHRRVGTYLPMRMEQTRVSRNVGIIKFRRWGITQKKAYNIQNVANVCKSFHEQSIPTFNYNMCHFYLYDLFKTNFIFLYSVCFVQRSACGYISQNNVISILCTSAFQVVF